ncbi:MAG: phosphoribosylamine--glycine ligase, partial [Lysobacterales bacterium]
PTAAYGEFTEVTQAIAFIRDHGAPIVVKADGLAAGKGVVIARSMLEAEAAVLDMLAGNVYGEAGHRVVIEEFLEGEEASCIVMADGRHVLPLASSQDHKAVGDGDTGPNTGGMGAYSPAPVVNESLHQRILQQVIQPTIDGMAAEGNPFCGFLYAGVMISPAGEVRVLEFNVRLGDPETQPLLMRLQSDLTAHCLASLEGRLDREQVKWDSRCSLGVVMAAGGYPGKFSTGEHISGLADFNHPGPVAPGVKVFVAGATDSPTGPVTSGGRVLCVCALGVTVAAAQHSAYQACAGLTWPGAFYRYDIGYRAIAREQNS